MIQLDAATVLLQWATGGLLFLWVTTRHRIVGIGYGWTLRITYLVMLVGSLVASALIGSVPARDACTAAAAVSAASALTASVILRRAGVAGERARKARRSAEIAAMTGIKREPAEVDSARREYQPWLDLLAPALGIGGLVAASLDTGGPVALSLARTLIGAAFLGAVSDAMLLGHWYLVQPGLGRAPLKELTRWVAVMWPFEVGALLWPTGMISVINGAVDDGYHGLLGWFWIACAIATIVLAGVTQLALREREYSAVMAATGLLYLAILTAFGTDLVARAVLAG